MKALFFFLLLQVMTAYAQHSGGSGGGGTRPYHGPSIPMFDEDQLIPCVKEDNVNCNYSMQTLRDFEKTILPILTERVQHCIWTPVRYGSIVEFNNHVMIKILVNKLKAEDVHRCGDVVASPINSIPFRDCFLDKNMKEWLYHFTLYPNSLTNYLKSEHDLSETEAKGLIENLNIIQGN